MKQIIFHFLLALPFFGHSQQYYSIKLSDTLNETRMGLWAKGDYKIYVELGIVETSLRNRGNGFLHTVENNNQEPVDSISNQMAKRFGKAADELKKAGNNFDLRNLVVYYGPVEGIVRQLVKNDSAAVCYYKGKRVYTLTRRDEAQGTGVDFGYDTLVYFDSAENYIFKYYTHLGW
jgi:hypothetical protein